MSYAGRFVGSLISLFYKPFKDRSLGGLVTGMGLFGGVSLVCAEIEKRCLLGSMFLQFGHFVHAPGNHLVLFPLISALEFVALSLLSCVFLLPLGKC